ncbi:MAG: hypothetical protein WA130_00585 [Candidatus Methanoperedens sp.]
MAAQAFLLAHQQEQIRTFIVILDKNTEELNITKNYICFVIIPFGDSDDEKNNWNQIYDAIMSVSQKISSNKVIFHRADTNPKSFHLIEGVHKNIEESHFCIADITGNNPNVLYEVGYAQAKGKEIISISKDIDQIPIDLKSKIVIEYSFENRDLFSQLIANLVMKAIEITQDKIHSVKNEYDIRCFENRKVAGLDTAFRDANNKIDILQTNIGTIINEN